MSDQKHNKLKVEVADDVSLANKYLNKARGASTRGLDFTITFSHYKRMMKIKTCKYTGVILTDPVYKKGAPLLPTDRTIDRIDPNKGYVEGNMVVCSHLANRIKATWEHHFTNKEMIKFIGKIIKLNNHE